MSEYKFFDGFVKGFLIGIFYFGVTWMAKKIHDQNEEIEEILSELEDCKEQLSPLEDCEKIMN